MLGGMPSQESEVDKKKGPAKTSDDEDGDADVKEDEGPQYVFAEDAKDVASMLADGKTTIADLQAKLKADSEKEITLPVKKSDKGAKAAEAEEEEEEEEADEGPEVLGADGKPVIRFRKPKKKAKMGQTIATVGASAPASQRKPSAAAAARPVEKKKEVAAPANKTLLSFGEDDEA